MINEDKKYNEQIELPEQSGFFEFTGFDAESGDKKDDLFSNADRIKVAIYWGYKY